MSRCRDAKALFSPARTGGGIRELHLCILAGQRDAGFGIGTKRIPASGQQREDAPVGSETVTVEWMGQTVTYPRASPMVRADVPRPEVAPPAPHPAPETLCRAARPEEIPASAQRLLGAFRGPWEAEVTYARGTTLGRLPKVVSSIVIRARKPGCRLWAAWLDGKFHAAMVTDHEGARRLSALQVRAYVMDGDHGRG